MNNSSFYENLGMFTSCKTNYDKDKDKMVNSTITDVFDCCLKQCIPPVNFCKNFCNTEKDHIEPTKLCDKKCEIQLNMCVDTCKLSSEYILPHSNLYKKCINKMCNSDKNYKCINDNKYEIKNCCMNNCTPNKNLTCEKYCDYFENFYSKNTVSDLFNSLTVNKSNNLQTKNNNTNKKVSLTLLIMITITTTIFIIFIAIIFKHLKS